jgi:hypothetical protein
MTEQSICHVTLSRHAPKQGRWVSPSIPMLLFLEHTHSKMTESFPPFSPPIVDNSPTPRGNELMLCADGKIQTFSVCYETSFQEVLHI